MQSFPFVPPRFFSRWPARGLIRGPARRPVRGLGTVALLVTLTQVGCATSTPPEAPPAASEVSADSLVQAGFELARRGDLLRAEHYFLAALERGAAPREVLRPLLDVCIRGSRFRAALEYAQSELQQTPDDVHLRFLVASLHFGLGNREQSRVELERIVAADRDHREAHTLLERLGETSSATPRRLDGSVAREVSLLDVKQSPLVAISKPRTGAGR